MKPRLVLGSVINDLETFKTFAAIAAEQSEAFDVRVTVGHLAHKDYEALRWGDDPYIQYSYNGTGMFDLVIPEEMEGFLNERFVEQNRALMRKKVDILSSHGLRGAIHMREPAYVDEAVYKKYPNWRGPRIDHPRRSRHPLFAVCFHNEHVQAVYRRCARAISTDYPEIDTWLALANDCGSGYCWSTNLYNGPNGPAACKSKGAAPAIAAYNRALIDGAGDAGVEAISIISNFISPEDARQARPDLPEGAYVPPEPRLRGAGSITARTWPIRHLSDPIRTALTGSRISNENPPDVISYGFDQWYGNDHTDLDSARLELTLLRKAMASEPRDFAGAMALVRDTLSEVVEPGAASDMLEGYRLIHEMVELMDVGGSMANLAGYGFLSARWFTRPFVAFQEELTNEEERHYLPHIFNPRGVQGRRDLLDIHGITYASVIDRNPEWNLRNGWFRTLSSNMERAADAFEKSETPRGQTVAKAARLMACVWRTCRNTVEFALLRNRAQEKPATAAIEGAPIGDVDRQRMYEVLREEIDNVRAFLDIWGPDDPERVVTIAGEGDTEDAFLFGADLRDQLERKIQIMVDKWEDVERLYEAPHI